MSLPCLKHFNSFFLLLELNTNSSAGPRQSCMTWSNSTSHLIILWSGFQWFIQKGQAFPPWGLSTYFYTWRCPLYVSFHGDAFMPSVLSVLLYHCPGQACPHLLLSRSSFPFTLHLNTLFFSRHYYLLELCHFLTFPILPPRIVTLPGQGMSLADHCTPRLPTRRPL